MNDSDKYKHSLLLEIKKLRAELEEKEKEILFFSNLTENGKTIVLLIDDNKIVYINNAVERITGYKKEEVYLTDFMDYIFPKDREIVSEKYKRQMSDLFTTGFSFRIITKKGCVKWFNADTTIINTDNKKLLKATLFDISEYKKDMNNLRKYEHLISATNDHLSFIDCNYIYTALNNNHTRAHKKKKTEIIGTSVSDLLGIDVFNENIKHRLDKTLNGEEVRYQIWLEFPDAGKRYMDIVFYPYYDIDNTVSGVIVSSHDISDLKKAETEIRKREEKYHFLYDNMLHGFIICEAVYDSDENAIDYRYKDVNNAVEKLTGEKKENIIGKKATDYLNKEKHYLIGVYGTLALTGGVLKQEAYIEKLDKYIEETIFGIRKGEFAILLNDITTQKKALLATEESERKYRALTEGILETVILATLTGEIVYVNDRQRIMFGREKSEVIGKDLTEFIDADDILLYKTQMNNILKDKKFENFEIHIKHKNGKLIPVEINGQLITIKKEYYIQGTFRDISERRIAEKILKKSEQKLRESNITKDKFFSIIAHDLKSPFSNIIGFSKLINDNFEKYDKKKIKSIIEMIYKSSVRTNDLLENLLKWASIQTGRIKFKPQRVNLKEIINKTVLIAENNLLQKNIKLTSDINEDIYINCDKNMTSTVIRNLLSNAIKFTPENGYVNIKSKEIQVEGKPFIEITVSDSGLGISKKKIQSLFNIEKTNPTKGTAGEVGTGLGLILYKEFIEKQGGSIKVESIEGEGSNFIFMLPKYI